MTYYEQLELGGVNFNRTAPIRSTYHGSRYIPLNDVHSSVVDSLQQMYDKLRLMRPKHLLL